MGNTLRHTNCLTIDKTDNNVAVDSPTNVKEFNSVEYIKANVDYNPVDNSVFCKHCGAVLNHTLFTKMMSDDIDSESCRCGRCSNIDPVNIVSVIDDFKRSYGIFENDINEPVRDIIIPFGFIHHDHVRKNVKALEEWKSDKGEYMKNKRLAIIQKAVKDKRTGLFPNWRPDRLEDYVNLLVGTDRAKNELEAFKMIAEKDYAQLEYLDITKTEEYAEYICSVQKEIERCQDIDINLVAYAKDRFDTWKAGIDGKRCYSLGQDKNSGLIKAFEVFNRYQEEYVKKIMERFSPLSEEDSYTDSEGNVVDLNKSVHVVLTYDRTKVSTIEEAMDQLSADCNRFFSRLRQIFKKRGKRLYYLKFVEMQKSGWPHLHVIFYSTDYLLPNGDKDSYDSMSKRNGTPTIQNIWKKGYTSVNKTDEHKGMNHPISYMYKYFKDSFGKKSVNEQGHTTQAMLWLFNIRSFTCDQETSRFLSDQEKLRMKTYGINDIEGENHLESDIEWYGIIFVNDKITPHDSVESRMKFLTDIVERWKKEYFSGG